MPLAAVHPAALDAVLARRPEGVDVVALDDEVDLDAVDFLVLGPGDRRAFDALPDLRRVQVVQVLAAGTDPFEGRIPPQATLCNARGARDAPVAEWCLGALLGASTALLASARERRWHDAALTDLGAWTVVVAGMGSIGRELERLLEPHGTQVVGVGSHAHDGLHGPDALPGLLADADALVILAPLTDATRGLIGARELAALPDGALVVNAGRGPVLDTEALLAEVSGPRLRAVLDVTDPEPLPDGHPLWSAPGVLAITPHLAGDSPRGEARSHELAADQLARWAAGEPLENVVR